jgi:hypothetical protein
MRLLRMALLIASFAVLLGGATLSSAISSDLCGATPAKSNLFQRMGSTTSTSVCAGDITASKSCCGTSICNCQPASLNGAWTICQGGPKGQPNPNAPCCIPPNNPNACFCANGNGGTVGGCFCNSATCT